MSARAPLPLRWLAALGGLPLALLRQTGDTCLFSARALAASVRRPWRLAELMAQAEFVGIGSLFIVGLTGTFTGAVFTLQSVNALSKVGMESMVGSTVMLAVARELGPVLTALMVSGRVGSAMATELGTMRVTEQLDALEVMAVDPVQYLVAPRLLACVLAVPCLCVVFDAVALVGTYVAAVWGMGIDEGAFLARIRWFVEPTDLVHGLLKSAVFGAVIAAVGCHRGFHADGGARGVGLATTQTVVICSVATFVLDYAMTALLLARAGS